MEISKEERDKFTKCREYMQLGYMCDAHPACRGCLYDVGIEIYNILLSEEKKHEE